MNGFKYAIFIVNFNSVHRNQRNKIENLNRQRWCGALELIENTVKE